jgi:hypothetical protein
MPLEREKIPCCRLTIKGDYLEHTAFSAPAIQRLSWDRRFEPNGKEGMKTRRHHFRITASDTQYFAHLSTVPKKTDADHVAAISQERIDRRKEAPYKETRSKPWKSKISMS